MDVELGMPEDEAGMLDAYAKVKRVAFSHFSAQRMVEELKKMIDESDCVEWVNEAARRRLNPERPLFLMNFKWDASIKAYPMKSGDGTVETWKAAVVTDEVALPAMGKVRDALEEAVEKGLLLPLTEMEQEALDYLMSSIFIINAGPERKDAEVLLRVFS